MIMTSTSPIINQEFEHPHWKFWEYEGTSPDGREIKTSAWRGKVKFEISNIDVTSETNLGNDDLVVTMNYEVSIRPDLYDGDFDADFASVIEIAVSEFLNSVLRDKIEEMSSTTKDE